MFKKIINRKAIFYSIVIISFAACTKDYITGGTIEKTNQYATISTYDVLSQFQQFDTLVQLINVANLKDTINKNGTTFFAVSNSSIANYLQQRTLAAQLVDQYAKFGLDSLLYYIKNNINYTRDSLLMYLVNTKTMPQNLTETGQIFPTHLAGDNVIISYEETTDPNLGYTSIISTPPHIVYFTQLWYPYHIGQDSTADMVPPSTGARTLVSTAFINTKNGVINVLTPAVTSNQGVTPTFGTTLFFYGTKQ